MKTLKDHVIIYDDECPMCARYTQAFIKTKMLENNGREAYSTFIKTNPDVLDKEKARNEIALINTHNGKITYGIDSLLTVMGNNFPLVTIPFRLKPFHWILGQLYSFISYNRKVIVPGKTFEGDNTCAPTFNLFYRWVYIIVSCIITGVVLNEYAGLLSELVSSGTFYQEFLICGGQIIFQGTWVALMRKERLIHYLGNMMTVSLAGSLLLLPGLFLINWLTSATLVPAIIWFGIVVSLMLAEHVRRIKILDIHWSASIGWIIYRLLVLLIVL